jgi:hypothetical protein
MKRYFIVVLLALALGGCAGSRTAQWDSRFGDATRAAFAQQVLDPDAARHAPPEGNTDGQIAAAAQQRYQKSYTEPPPPGSVFTIGVSGAK